ncbi:toll/interleukin-1 receptor domain-containing protein [Tautonia plasticadhaerens]|uniref:TIR domain-containing protein n=1 Tax=Tautonia plasticadhaerens TaxID=2527974 RepID=A0A518HB66_9BACT|nr:toll/interleukin-1 receptor domain-containing protein [Tautonia plasticadhaerens]QDV38104.1 hypothetical protein ElP_60530 [Tautonia plasticadhaerens]
MTKNEVTYDVFLSASTLDVGVAEVVRRSFESRGLTVFSALEMKAGVRFEDVIRSAMAEARIFVAILTRASMSSANFAVEFGAALAWGKFIYLLNAGISPRDMPAWLSHYRLAPISELDQVIDAILGAIEPLSEEQAVVLGEAYGAVGVASEQLSSRPSSLDQLTQRFNRRAGTSFSPERILQEVIRLRKRGDLPKLSRKTR